MEIRKIELHNVKNNKFCVFFLVKKDFMMGIPKKIVEKNRISK